MRDITRPPVLAPPHRPPLPAVDVPFSALGGAWHMLPTAIGPQCERDAVRGRLLYDWRRYATPEGLAAGPPAFRLELGALVVTAAGGPDDARRDELYLSLITARPDGEAAVHHVSGTDTDDRFHAVAREQLTLSPAGRVERALEDVPAFDPERLAILRAALERLHQHRIVTEEAALAAADTSPRRGETYHRLRAGPPEAGPRPRSVNRVGGYAIPHEIPRDVAPDWSAAYAKAHDLENRRNARSALLHTLGLIRSAAPSRVDLIAEREGLRARLDTLDQLLASG